MSRYVDVDGCRRTVGKWSNAEVMRACVSYRTVCMGWGVSMR
jgi:hypothetical protein